MIDLKKTLLAFRVAAVLVCCLTVLLAPLSAAEPAAEPAAGLADGPADAVSEPVEFSSEQQAAREEVINSERWKAARYALEEWFSIQTAYSAEEVAFLKEEFRVGVSRMNASELEDFLFDMEQKLSVLMSPELAQERDRLTKYLSPQRLQATVKRYGAEDPLGMSATQLAKAVQQFQDELSIRNREHKAYSQLRTKTNTHWATHQKAQAKAAEAARNRAAASASRAPSSPLAPRNKQYQRYRPPAGSPRFTIGPWGGAWIGLR